MERGKEGCQIQVCIWKKLLHLVPGMDQTRMTELGNFRRGKNANLDLTPSSEINFLFLKVNDLHWGNKDLPCIENCHRKAPPAARDWCYLLPCAPVWFDRDICVNRWGIILHQALPQGLKPLRLALPWVSAGKAWLGSWTIWSQPSSVDDKLPLSTQSVAVFPSDFETLSLAFL